ncbi:hypothetical protein PGB90_005392 [Kerria lacca]
MYEEGEVPEDYLKSRLVMILKKAVEASIRKEAEKRTGHICGIRGSRESV